jgi:hypothetical protein
MSTLRIIFDYDGTAAVMIPVDEVLTKLGTVTDDGKVTGNLLYTTEESKLIHIANKRLPTGTKYEIIDTDVTDISDRTFRDAWEYTAGAAEKTSADISSADLLKYNMDGQTTKKPGEG